MSNSHETDEFERRSRELLRDSVDDMDAATRSRLTQARHAALAARERGPAWLNLRALAPGGAVAAALLVAFLVWQPAGKPPDAGSALDDIDLLADSDIYELSQEPDLEFIEWAAAMASQDAVGG